MTESERASERNEGKKKTNWCKQMTTKQTRKMRKHARKQDTVRGREID